MDNVVDSGKDHSNMNLSRTCNLRCSTESFGRSEYVWKSSSKYIDPGYGHERDWRSSRARVEGGGDSHLAMVVSPLPLDNVKEWKSSIRYIDPGRSCATAREWRSSIKTVETYRGHGEQSRWKPAVRVFKLAECRTEWRMTSGRRHVKSITHEEPSWHASRGPGRPPQLKWAPPFRNAKLASHIVCKNNGSRKKVPEYSTTHPHLRLFPETMNMIPNMKEIRAKVDAYFKLHPPLHLFSTSFQMAGHGGKGDEPNRSSYHSWRRYIPEGHEHHFESSGCITKASTLHPPCTIRMWTATGPQHDTASCRNVILGKFGPSEDWKPDRVRLGASLLAPAGTYNEDIINHRFSPEDWAIYVRNMSDDEVTGFVRNRWIRRRCVRWLRDL